MLQYVVGRRVIKTGVISGNSIRLVCCKRVNGRVFVNVYNVWQDKETSIELA